jgi:hypothetical protein
MKSLRLIALAAHMAAAGLLVACGGGGGSGGGETAAESTTTTTPSAVSLTIGSQTYRVAAQFGVVFDLTMDFDANTYAYTAPGVRLSGAMTKSTSGTYRFATGISGQNLRAEVAVKDGALSGALLVKHPYTGLVATSLVAGANTKLVLKDTSKVASRYTSVRIGAGGCTADGSTASGTACGDAAFGAAAFAKPSGNTLTITSCSVSSPTLQSRFAQDPGNCPLVDGQSSANSSSAAMDGEGKTTLADTAATDAAEFFFADFGGKAVGFFALAENFAGTSGDRFMQILLPTEQGSTAAEVAGAWTLVSKAGVLEVNLRSLTDLSVTEYGYSSTAGVQYSGTQLSLNNWATGVNLATVASPSYAMPVMVAGPWVATHNESFDISYIGLKR